MLLEEIQRSARINDNGGKSSSSGSITTDGGTLDFIWDTTGTFSEGFDNYNSEFYIENVTVEEEYRRQGIATVLLNRAIEYARRLDIDVMTLRKDYGMGGDGRTDGHLDALYGKAGFKHVPNNPDAMYLPL